MMTEYDDVGVSNRVRERAAITGADPERLQYAFDVFATESEDGGDR